LYRNPCRSVARRALVILLRGSCGIPFSHAGCPQLDLVHRCGACARLAAQPSDIFHLLWMSSRMSADVIVTAASDVSEAGYHSCTGCACHSDTIFFACTRALRVVNGVRTRPFIPSAGSA
jgi:hypothetical protein